MKAWTARSREHPHCTVSVAVFDAPPAVAVIVTTVVAATVLVATVNEVDVCPGGTVTNAGACAAKKALDCRFTITEPAGAGPSRVTVPVALVPPGTVVGLMVRPDSLALTAGVTDNAAV